MIQQYFLILCYLVLSALLFLVDSYRKQLSFVIRIKGILMENRHYLDAYFISGIIIALWALFVPMYPGPGILGDLVPSLWTIYSAFFFRFRFSEKRNGRGEAYFETSTMSRTARYGWITVMIAVIHFILPGYVLL